MKKELWFVIIGVVFIVLLLIVASMIPEKEEKKVEEDLLGISYDVEGNESSLNYDTENPVVAMYIKGYGSIVMELYPKTVANFISLTKSGFYDQNTFHRLVPGFVLQGGDPDGTGSGGPEYSIKGEFTDNGFENNLSHKKWVISMARTSDNMDSAGSQFFICLGDASNSLDGGYAAFGKVIDGFDTIELIAKKEKIADSQSGKLKNNLTIEKSLVDLKGKEYPEVEKVQ